MNGGLLLETSLGLLLVAYCISLALAAPTRVNRELSNPASGESSTDEVLRWHQPCAGSNSVETSHITPSADSTPRPFDHKEEYKHIKNGANRSSNDCQQLIRKYIDDRFKDDEILVQLSPISHDGLPVIPDIHTTDRFNATELLHTSYDWFVRFAVFMDQLRIDEFKRSKKTADNFHDEVQELEENAIYWLLCKIKSTLHGHNIFPETSITKDLMKANLRTGNSAARDIVNFIIVRDLNKALIYLREALVIVDMYESESHSRRS